MNKKLMPNISIFAIAAIWFAYGLLVAYGISSDQRFYEFGYSSWESLREIMPSIARMDRFEFFDRVLPKLHASVMVLSVPVLFVALLFTDVEESIAGVRKNHKEAVFLLILGLVVVLLSFSGFGYKGPNGIFRNNLTGFSFLSSFITYAMAYAIRLIYCVVFKK